MKNINSIQRIKEIKEKKHNDEKRAEEARKERWAIIRKESDREAYNREMKKLVSRITELIEENKKEEHTLAINMIQGIENTYYVDYKNDFNFRLTITFNNSITELFVHVIFQELRETRKFTMNEKGKLGWRRIDEQQKTTDDFMTTDELVNFWFDQKFMNKVIEDFKF